MTPARPCARIPLAILVAAVLAGPAALHAQRPAVPARTHRVTTNETAFLLDGRPLQIISGEMHYPRIPRAYWRDRMRMARAMGLNTITTTRAAGRRQRRRSPTPTRTRLPERARLRRQRRT